MGCCLDHTGDAFRSRDISSRSVSYRRAEHGDITEFAPPDMAKRSYCIFQYTKRPYSLDYRLGGLVNWPIDISPVPASYLSCVRIGGCRWCRWVSSVIR